MEIRPSSSKDRLRTQAIAFQAEPVRKYPGTGARSRRTPLELWPAPSIDVRRQASHVCIAVAVGKSRDENRATDEAWAHMRTIPDSHPLAIRQHKQARWHRKYEDEDHAGCIRRCGRDRASFAAAVRVVRLSTGHIGLSYAARHEATLMNGAKSRESKPEAS